LAAWWEMVIVPRVNCGVGDGWISGKTKSSGSMASVGEGATAAVEQTGQSG